MDDNNKLVLYAVIGLVVVAGIALFATQSQTSSITPPSNTAAINGIVSSNINAQNVQGAVQQSDLTALNSIEGAIVAANTSIKLNTQNNATALSINKTNSTLALDEAQLQADTAKYVAGQQATTAEAIANISANEQETLGTIAANTSVTNTAANDAAVASAANAQAGAQKSNGWSNVVGGLINGLTSFFTFSSPNNNSNSQSVPANSGVFV